MLLYTSGGQELLIGGKWGSGAVPQAGCRRHSPRWGHWGQAPRSWRQCILNDFKSVFTNTNWKTLFTFVMSAHLNKTHVFSRIFGPNPTAHDIFSEITAHFEIPTTHFVLQNTLFWAVLGHFYLNYYCALYFPLLT